MDALIKYVGYGGFDDYTTGVWFVDVDVEDSEYKILTSKLKRLDARSKRNKTIYRMLGRWLKLYANIRLISAQVVVGYRRGTVYKLQPG